MAAAGSGGWRQLGLNPNILVKDLFNGQGRWNRNLIKVSFSAEDADCILSIPLSLTNQSDMLRWHYDRLGTYNVRSGYRVALDIKESSSSSDSAGSIKWWKSLWKLPIPSKIRVFVWRCFNNWLPVKSNLIQRGMHIDSTCPVAGLLKPKQNWQVKDLLLQGYHVYQKSDFISFCVLLWMLWNNRNSILFGSRPKPDNQIVDWANDFIIEYQKSMCAGSQITKQRKEAQVTDTDMRWIPPRQGTFCVNVDA
ncbi:uncharacterized protein LOC126687899 [Mercurialis annua]|uniref:uncharacterized protein LOC126687899 n=1 Tax=Mercurialis annua TaxID=3986 RepID=UPI00215F3795|nr:uncharacterized protein LOC126687899 [Mercurialis annua]